MDHGRRHQCTSTQDGHDLLRVLATEVTTQKMTITDTLATSKTEEPRVRKTGQSRMLNRMIWFPRKQLQFLVIRRGREHPMSLLLISWGAFKRRWGQRVNLQPIAK
jgi:hypothetical protein